MLPVRVLRAVEKRSTLARRVKFRMRWASTRRIDPVSEWGFDRGTAVDRYYIERFLHEHRDLVHGRTLEVKEDLYATGLGAEQVDVLDIDPKNPAATIVGDVCDPLTLPVGAFDAAIVTQTLQLVPDPVAGLQNVLRALRPGAAALVTVPAMSRLAGDWDRWRWTARGLRDLVERAGGRVWWRATATRSSVGPSSSVRPSTTSRRQSGTSTTPTSLSSSPRWWSDEHRDVALPVPSSARPPASRDGWGQRGQREQRRPPA